MHSIILSKIIFHSFEADLDGYDAVVATSMNALKGLENFLQNKENVKIKLPKIYVLSKKQADFAKKLGFERVFYPSLAYASTLASEFCFTLQKVLLLRAKKISSKLDEKLVNQGAFLTQIIAYENKALQKDEIYFALRQAKLTNLAKNYKNAFFSAFIKNTSCKKLLAKAKLYREKKAFLPKNSVVIFLAASGVKEYKKYFYFDGATAVAIGKECAKSLKGEKYFLAKVPSFASCIQKAYDLSV